MRGVTDTERDGSSWMFFFSLEEGPNVLLPNLKLR